MNSKKIVIFGSAGTGKSSTGKLLAKTLDYEFKSTGNLMREKAQDLGISIYEFEELCKKDSKYDLELDSMVENFGKSHEGFVFESRLAWYFIPDGLKIYFYCDGDLVFERISKRESLSLAQSRQLTTKRNEAILSRYSAIYPQINYPPKKEDFDLIVDTTGDSVEDSVVKIMNFLEKNNLLE